MENPPSDSEDSTPPPPGEAEAEEPVPAVPTSETTPVWAHTVPVEPADDAADDTAEDAPEALPPVAMQNKGQPDWSKTQTPSSNGEGKKSTPGWAATVPTSPGETIPETTATAEGEGVEAEGAEAEAAAPETPRAEASEPPHDESPTTQPLKTAATDEAKKSWPPSSERAPAPPEETDIWPPEPPTERAMPAWPPPSELEIPATPARPIPSWPNSFDAVATPPTIPPAPAEPAPSSAPPAPAPAMPPAAAAPPAPVSPPPPVPKAAPAPMPPPASTPVPPAPQPPASPAAPAAPAVTPVSGAPARPAWAPGPSSPTTSTPRQVESEAPMQVPMWAPRVPLAGETGQPTWFSPKEAIPHATAQPIVTHAPEPESAPAPPIEGGQLPVAPIPSPAAPAQAAAGKPTWEVVEQHGKTDKNARATITAEDRSYAEWFAWAKRGGAPASACHAAAQGAFKALSSGKDVMTAVQWATAAMSQPPENVPYARQSYCAWFSLANIDLNLDQHRAHLFAGAAVQALDGGADPSGAHAAGLAAAGIR